jgi:hypothetical protein
MITVPTDLTFLVCWLANRNGISARLSAPTLTIQKLKNNAYKNSVETRSILLTLFTYVIFVRPISEPSVFLHNLRELGEMCLVHTVIPLTFYMYKIKYCKRYFCPVGRKRNCSVTAMHDSGQSRLNYAQPVKKKRILYSPFPSRRCPFNNIRTINADRGGYKYGDVAFQVGGASDETVKYGLSFAGLRPKSDCSGKVQKQFTVNYRPVLSSERSLQNKKPATV